MTNSVTLDMLPGICEAAVAAGETAGGVLWVGEHDSTRTVFPFGSRAVEPVVETMTLDTIFDLASLTKPIVTATLIMRAVERGMISLEDPISRYLPIPPASPVADVTPRLLLLHTSGLPAGRPIPPNASDTSSIVGAMVEGGLACEPGTAFIYSDVGFHLLAAIVESVFAEQIDILAARHVFEPLRTLDLGYGVTPDRRERTAPTEKADGTLLRGVVHDPPARQIGGVAGHAGLFGTAADCSRFCRMILRRGELDGNRILEPATVDRMIAPVQVPGGKLRSLGWDVDTQYSNPRGELFDIGGIGHTGFTGPSIWIDPRSGIYIVLLTSRLHPDGTGNVVRLRRVVANVVAASLLK